MHNFQTDLPILAIPKILQDPAAVKTFLAEGALINPNPVVSYNHSWDCLSLSEGYPGLLLLFSSLQKGGYLGREGEEIAHRYVLAIKQTIETKGLPENLSLFSGLAGICFAIQEASIEGKRYQRMLSTLQTLLLDLVQASYLTPLQKNIRSKLPSSSTLYDLIQGLSGIGRYALENLSNPRFAQLAQEIAKSLIAFIQPIPIEGHRVPGWYLPPSDVLNIYKKPAQSSKGNFNLGLAHGVPGILGFLSIALLRGVEVEGQKEAIAQIGKWIIERSFLDRNAIRWAHAISLEEEIDQKPSSNSSRDAWCYGAPGISRTLFLAGKALCDEALKKFAVKAFCDIFSRTREQWNLPGPTICHGIAGLLLIANAMAQEEGCDALVKPTSDLTQELISAHDPDSPFGFRDIEPCLGGGSVALDKPGLLEGGTGPLLTLLTLRDRSAKWHLPFLLHE